MDVLNELFQELGISKVRLAKYLGVSRQMVYNYLELKDINHLIWILFLQAFSGWFIHVYVVCCALNDYKFK